MSNSFELSGWMKCDSMSEKHQEPCHNSSVCGLDLTLPLDFVREWIHLTTKQHWTAKVKDCDVVDSDVPSSESVPPQQISADGNEISSVLETDMSVVTDVLSAQKSYLHARITGVHFCIKEGRLQLKIVDVKAISCDTNTGGESSDDVNSQTPCSPPAFTSSHSPAAPADCVGQIECNKLLPESSTELHVDPCERATTSMVVAHGINNTSHTPSDTRDMKTSAESSKTSLTITGTHFLNKFIK